MRKKTTIREISCLVFRFMGEIPRFLLQARDSPLALFMCFRQVVPDVRFRKRHARANPPAPDGFPNHQPCSGRALLRKRNPPSLTVGNMITHFPEKRKSLQHSAFIFCVFFKPSPEPRKVITTAAMDNNMKKELCIRTVTELGLQYGKNLRSDLSQRPGGSQHTREAYRTVLRETGLVQSLSGTEDCFDNARMESFLRP